MIAFIRNLRAKRQLRAIEMNQLVEDHVAALWWQTVLDMQVLRDEAAELEEDLLETEFAENWDEFHRIQAKQWQVAAVMHNLFPDYEIASEELLRRDFVLPY